MRLRLWKILRQKEIKQKVFAEQVDIHPVRICQIITLAVKPTPTEISKICKALNLSEREVFTTILREDHL